MDNKEQTVEYNEQYIDSLESFHSVGNNGKQEKQDNHQFQVDPSVHTLFNEQCYQTNESQMSYNEEFQENEQSQMANQMIDPSIITPEYLQMFNQFYSMFSSLQNNMAGDQEQLNDPSFLQNLMFTYFTSMIQNQQQTSDDVPQSPKVTRDYNNNLPLAAIPEIKDSMLEENSRLITIKTNKLGLLMSANSTMGKDQQCSCCVACQDHKIKGVFQQCSNFNASLPNTNRNSQVHPDTLVPKSAISSTSKILNSPFRLGSMASSPQLNIRQDIYSKFNTASSQVNQDLNKLFQIQQPQQNIAFDYQNPSLQRKQSQQTEFNFENQKPYQIASPQHFQNKENNQIIMSPMFSPKQQQVQHEVLSPKQIQENKVIEYMLDNNDLSNNKQRWQLIKGDRLSRTLSRSSSKNSQIKPMHRNHQSIYSQNTNNFNQSQYQGQQNQYAPYDNKQQFFSEVKPSHQQNSNNFENQVGSMEFNKENLMFFSPQLHTKQQCNTYENSFEDLIGRQGNMMSPNTERNQMKRGGQKNKSKRTQEKVQEIRKINELNRGKEQPKKSQTRLNPQKSQKNVFEIKDLKKSKSRKNTHGRKQSYNVIANKENQQLLQSNYQNNYELSHENIVLSPNQDLMFFQEDQNHHSRKDSDTFKSLASVWNNKYNHNNQLNQLGDSGSPQIANLNFKLDNGFKPNNITPFENTSLNQLRIKPQSIDSIRFSEKFEQKKPGQEIHIIKKPHQTKEQRKIQERLNKYYQSKKKDEEELRNKNSNQQQYQQIPNEVDTMSMTKTLSSFKSLMMKTMSQMSMHQDNSIQHQFEQGKDQRTKQGSKVNGMNNNGNQSVNISNIHDDFSCVGEVSDNLTKMISPKNLYNGSLGYIKQRNPQQQQKPQGQSQSSQQNPKSQDNQKQSQQCLPNTLFFKQQNQVAEETMSLKYNSRQPSICQCRQANCECDQTSKKDLLGHFQNFLCEMDKHQISNQMKHQSRDSLYQSPITNIGANTSTSDFLQSNLQFLGMGRSSSQNSRLKKGTNSKRQSSFGGQCQMIQNPRMKRFSSGANLAANIPLKIMNTNFQHCQSTQQIPDNLQLKLYNQDDDIILAKLNSEDLDAHSTQSKTQGSSYQLEKLDTNKEEEIRLLHIENDFMHKAFIQKSHKLNLQSNQRQELLQRIQKHKENQLITKNISVLSVQEEGSQGVMTTQNTSNSSNNGKQGANQNIKLNTQNKDCVNTLYEERNYQRQNMGNGY